MLRALASAAAAATLFYLSACGSSNSDDVFGRPQQTTSSSEDASTSSGSTSDASTTTPNAGDLDAGNLLTTDGAPGTKIDAAAAGPNCNALLSEVEKTRKEAVVCSVVSPYMQCSQSLDDLCCKLFVTSTDSQAATDFKKAVKAFEDAKCTVDCSYIKCTDQPTNTCNPTGGTRGVCKQ